jgi:hypothetical protein
VHLESLNVVNTRKIAIREYLPGNCPNRVYLAAFGRLGRADAMKWAVLGANGEMACYCLGFGLFALFWGIMG